MDNLVDPAEPPDIQIARLKKIGAVLMRRVETWTDRDGAAYPQFERAVALEDQVRRRTEEMERALRLLNGSNAKLSAANSQIEGARRDLASAIEAVQEDLAFFGADDLLLLFNGRFCWQMPEVSARLRPGMRFADYVQIVSRSAKLLAGWNRRFPVLTGLPPQTFTLGTRRSRALSPQPATTCCNRCLPPSFSCQPPIPREPTAMPRRRARRWPMSNASSKCFWTSRVLAPRRDSLRRAIWR